MQQARHRRTISRFVVFIVETPDGRLQAQWTAEGFYHECQCAPLGANEAPPAIISSFLGKQLTDLLDHIEKADKEELFALTGKKGMELDILRFRS